MKAKINRKPSVIGIRKSFGFGDRLGLATPGHIASVTGSQFTPYFAQQSIRELSRTKRFPEEVISSAAAAVDKSDWSGVWGADADHLQTQADVKLMAQAGYTMFTIDPSSYINGKTEEMNEEQLYENYQWLKEENYCEIDELFDLYLGKSYTLNDDLVFSFYDKIVLLRIIVKFIKSICFTEKMFQEIREACSSNPFEIEFAVDETTKATTSIQHLFMGLELKRRNINIVGFAPKFDTYFERGIDYHGDLKRFEKNYREHHAIANFCGPYKLSIHSGSDKFNIFPIIAQISGELLHIKTTGTSYLEGLRTVVRSDKKLFREIVAFCREHYKRDRVSYMVSADPDDISNSIADDELENSYLNSDTGRQILHVTYGSVLREDKNNGGNHFKERIYETIDKKQALYQELLCTHLGKHIKLLSV
jgi:hypothetical protein